MRVVKNWLGVACRGPVPPEVNEGMARERDAGASTVIFVMPEQGNDAALADYATDMNGTLNHDGPPGGLSDGQAEPWRGERAGG